MMFLGYQSGEMSKQTKWRKVRSKWREIKLGVPQSGVLSLMLFDIYMSKLSPPSKDINMKSYAFTSQITSTSTTSHPQVEKLHDMTTPCIIILHDCLETRKLKISAKDSSATVFTTWSKEAKFDPHITINNSPIPVNSKVKVLCVIFDSMFIFGELVRTPKRK